MSFITNLERNHIFVSRASTAIYIVLKTLGFQGRKILVPANICYAAVYPIIYSGNIPIFCDVKKTSGNVTFEICVKHAEEVDGMLLPHMYGNPIKHIDKIAALCNEKNLLLIEDCASAMGAYSAGRLCGSWGDFSVFSLGYSKTLDIGSGGILFSNHDLGKFEENYKALPKKTSLEEQNEAFFSKLYRLIRNNTQQELSHYIWRGLLPGLKKTFVHYEPGIETKIKDALEDLDIIISQRKTEMELYKKFLPPCKYFEIYAYEKSAVPWRFSLIAEPAFRKELIAYFLEHNLPVSDWYPVVTPIFGISGEFPGAGYMEKRLINFPLLIGEEQIYRICKGINYFINKMEHR